MVTVDLRETNLEELLALVGDNVEVLLVIGDLQVARLSPVERTNPAAKVRIPGLHAGTTWISDDFDEPLPDAFWLGEA